MRDERKLTQSLKNLSEKKHHAIAWSLELDILKQVSLKFRRITKEYLIFDYSEFQRPFLEALITIDRKIKLHIPDEGLFIFCTVREINKDQIFLSMPIVHEYEDRRKIDRKSVDADLAAIFVKENIQILKKNVADISSGGFSIILMKSESNPFLDREQVKVEIKEIGLKTEVELVSQEKITPFQWESTPYGGSRLSFKFKENNDRFKAIMDVFLSRYHNSGL